MVLKTAAESSRRAGAIGAVCAVQGAKREARQTTGFTGRLRSGKPASTLLRRLFLPRGAGEPTHAARFGTLSACWQRQLVCWWRGRSMTGCRDARARSSASGRRCQETGAQPAVDLPVVQARCPAMGAVHRRPRAAARAPDLRPVGAPFRRNAERGWAHWRHFGGGDCRPSQAPWWLLPGQLSVSSGSARLVARQRRVCGRLR